MHGKMKSTVCLLDVGELFCVFKMPQQSGDVLLPGAQSLSVSVSAGGLGHLRLSAANGITGVTLLASLRNTYIKSGRRSAVGRDT